jgi:hypothetical protein
MEFYTVITNKLGVFTGETLMGSKEQYNRMLDICKHFHEQESYYQYLDNGDFFVIGKEIIKDSIIQIKIKE